MELIHGGSFGYTVLDFKGKIMSCLVWRIVWSIDTFLSQLSSAAILAATSTCSRYNRIA